MALRRVKFPAFVLALLALLSSVRALADEGIFVMRRNGNDARKVIRVDGFSHHCSPRWSHDGQWLAFDAWDGRDNDSKRFFVVNLNGGDCQQVGIGDLPDWSPDDKQLVYWHHGGNNERFGVWVQNVGGGGREWLAEGGSARWSPDGSRIAYAWEHILRLIDLVEIEPKILVDEQFEENLVAFDWSPDGKRIAFVNRRKGENARKLFLVKLDDPQPQATPVDTRPGRLGSHVSWAPNGKQLAINVDHHIYVIDPAMPKIAMKLPNQRERSYDPSISPDGQWIAFARRPNQ